MSADRLAIPKMPVDDLGQDCLVQSAVPGTVRVDHHDRTKVAGVQAAGTCGKNVPWALIHAGFLQPLSQEGTKLCSTGRGTTGPMAEQHVVIVRRDH